MHKVSLKTNKKINNAISFKMLDGCNKFYNVGMLDRKHSYMIESLTLILNS